MDDISNKTEETGLKESVGINFKEILYKYLSYSWLFILVLGVCSTAAWLYIRYNVPQYKVSATLLLKDNDPRTRSQSGELFADLLMAQGTLNKINEIEVLKSRSLMMRVIKVLGLQTDCRVLANVKTTNTYGSSPFELQVLQLQDSTTPLSFIIKTSKDGFTIKSGKRKIEYDQIFETNEGTFRLLKKASNYHNTTYDEYQVSWFPEVIAAAIYAGNLQVRPADERANVLSLTYITENPKLGADILNQLMEEYNNSNIDDKNLINKKALAFIDDRLAIVEKQLDSVENNLQLYKRSNHVIDLATQSSFYFDNLKTSIDNADQLEIQLSLIDILVEYLQDSKNNLQKVPSTLGLNDPTLLELTGGYNKLILERELQLQTGATESSIVIRNTNATIEETRLKLLENLRSFKRALTNTASSLQSKVNSFRSEINRIPEKERESRERTRQQQIKQNLYLYLLQKKEESALSQASTIASSKVVDNALDMAEQVSPKILNIYSIALLVGILLPLGIVFVVDLLNDKITVRSDIEKNTTAPIIAEIGHNRDDDTLVFDKKNRTIIAEQFRMLRSSLKYLMGDKKATPVILVTSSISGEGKSFVSTNLAASLAIMGKRTVILEFDLRKPRIMDGLKLAKAGGLSNYLVGELALDKLTVPVPEVPNLFAISSGPIPPNPSELLLSSRIDELFHYLKQHFDYIIVDTAPVGLVSDSYTLSLYADASLYIIRQGYTLKRQLHMIQDNYVKKKLPAMGLLINDIKLTGKYRGYYGYGGSSYYGYSYGYGGYYSDSDKKGRSLLRRLFSRRKS